MSNLFVEMAESYSFIEEKMAIIRQPAAEDMPNCEDLAFNGVVDARCPTPAQPAPPPDPAPSESECEDAVFNGVTLEGCPPPNPKAALTGEGSGSPGVSGSSLPGRAASAPVPEPVTQENEIPALGLPVSTQLAALAALSLAAQTAAKHNATRMRIVFSFP